MRVTSQAAVKSDGNQPWSYGQYLRRTDLARARVTIEFLWDKPGYIYREDAYGAPKTWTFS